MIAPSLSNAEPPSRIPLSESSLHRLPHSSPPTLFRIESPAPLFQPAMSSQHRSASRLGPTEIHSMTRSSKIPPLPPTPESPVAELLEPEPQASNRRPPSPPLRALAVIRERNHASSTPQTEDSGRYRRSPKM